MADLPPTTPVNPNTPTPDGVPRRIGKYEVQKELGCGQYGRVYLAHDPVLDRDVAIKMPLDTMRTAGLRERFLREARAIARIRHQNVCEVYEADAEGDVPFLVMRYVAGGTLADLLKRRHEPFAAPEAAVIVRKLAMGVAAAHAKDILHRDLKPANVLWDEEHQDVLVTDFGLARIADAASISVSGEAMGTPLYTSPEQFRGRSAQIGPQTDVYSLGVILYELVTGGHPFTGSTHEIMSKVAFEPGEAPAPSSIRPGLDPRIDVPCAKALAKRSADRFPSAKAFADALAEFDPVTPPKTIAPRLGESASDPKPGEILTLRVPRAEMQFAWIPPGAFQMGGNGQGTNPPHVVTISEGFWMGTTPVTQSQWRAVMGTNPSKFKGDDRPVEMVSWDDCQKFCRKLGERTRKQIRLPTEAEWEYACRAGTTSEYCSGDGIDALMEAGWFDGNSDAQTHRVGMLQANAWGLHDVHGNVWEWCQDWLGNLHPGQQTDPTGPRSGKSRVHRGGSWKYQPMHCLSAYRSDYSPNLRDQNVGVRVCFLDNR